jgi:dihydrofolate reductase
MKFFKQMTVGKVVVMGEETFKSLPGQEPLKDRINIVLSNNESFKNNKVTICRSLDDLFYELKSYNYDDVFVTGGESVYTQLLPFCSEAYVTRIQNIYEADKYFPDLDKEESWELVSASDPKSYNDIPFVFNKYINNQARDYFENTGG